MWKFEAVLDGFLKMMWTLFAIEIEVDWGMVHCEPRNPRKICIIVYVWRGISESISSVVVRRTGILMEQVGSLIQTKGCKSPLKIDVISRFKVGIRRSL